MAAHIDWTGVKDTIAKAEAEGCVVGLGAIAPSGERFSHNGGRRFVAASVVKIGIMVELYRRFDAGSLKIDQRHTLTKEDKSQGSGVALHLSEGTAFTLGDLAYLMMSISDNTATNILIDYTGMAEVNAAMKSLGMAASTLGRKMRGRPRIEGEEENWAIPDEYATAVKAILDDKAASAASCAAMVALLEKQQNDRRIARHLPKVDRPRWGTKTGTLVGVANDVGFVMTPKGPAVLAVFVEKPDILAAEQVIGDVARAVLQAS